MSQPESTRPQAFDHLNKAVATDGRVTIDMTPTWGQWGNVYRNLAESGERKALVILRPDFARAMAAAQALQELSNAGLTDEQSKLVSEVIGRELTKQGF